MAGCKISVKRGEVEGRCRCNITPKPIKEGKKRRKKKKIAKRLKKENVETKNMILKKK